MVRQPDLPAQRAAMSRLGFLVGVWAGEASITPPGGGAAIELNQTEIVEFKLEGLILSIEGIGRSSTDGRAVLQAFAIISFDDETISYRMRAFNDGRYLETDVTLANDGKGITWGFELGPVKTSSVLRITEAGEWTEVTELAIGSDAPQKYMEVCVRPRVRSYSVGVA